MPPVLQLEMASRLEEIPRARDEVSRWLARNGAFEGAGFLAGLAIEELATNSLKYGYDDLAVHRIGIRLELAGAELRVQVEDDGRPFNPLEQPDPDLTLPAEARPVGGLGLHLLRGLFDRIEYRREGGLNRVTLVKRGAGENPS